LNRNPNRDIRRGLAAPPVTQEQRAYPLAIVIGADEVAKASCDSREGLPRRVTVTRLDSAAAAAARIVAVLSALGPTSSLPLDWKVNHSSGLQQV
jgi:hypothetical protein